MTGGRREGGKEAEQRGIVAGILEDLPDNQPEKFMHDRGRRVNRIEFAKKEERATI